MNIFEDLVEELREENLLEETVKTPDQKSNDGGVGAKSDSRIETASEDSSAEILHNAKTQDDGLPVPDLDDGDEDEEMIIELSDDSIVVGEPVSGKEDEFAPPTGGALADIAVKTIDEAPSALIEDANGSEGREDDIAGETAEEAEAIEEVAAEPVNEVAAELERRIAEVEAREAGEQQEEIAEKLEERELVEEKEDIVSDEPSEEVSNKENAAADEKASEDDDVDAKDIYRQRVMDRVTSLQMVDHIYSGVEREQMRSKPDPFDHIPVKKSLHKFFEAFEALDSPQTTAEESELMQQVAKWHSALLQRDAKISAKDLRVYCESANPTLSSKAMMALVRFYRNSPFSEPVRSKFDLAVTRLFTKDAMNNLREMVFGRDDLIAHLKELYADWSSTPLYEEDEENSEIVLAAFKFQDYISEAKKVKKFDELIKNGFFKRIKGFKTKQQENFFAPLLVAAAIESNVAIGNRYIELITAERKDQDLTRLEDKYGELHDQAISDATSKTLELAELLHDKKENESAAAEKAPNKVGSLFLNKKILIPILALIIFAIISVIVWGAVSSGDGAASESDTGDSIGEKFDLENSSFNHYLKSAYISQETLFATAKPSWKELKYEEKASALRKMHLAGSDRGYSKVQLMNDDNASIGFASNSGVNVLE